MAIGLASIAAYIGAGGLGVLIFQGISTGNTDQVLSGAVAICGLPPLYGFISELLVYLGLGRLPGRHRPAPPDLIARYGAWPVVWCGAGEGNLPWYLAKGFPYDDREQVHGWTEVLRFIRATDPFHRPLTIHPTAINKYTSRHATDDAALSPAISFMTPRK
jgi:hypothetical protein